MLIDNLIFAGMNGRCFWALQVNLLLLSGLVLLTIHGNAQFMHGANAISDDALDLPQQFSLFNGKLSPRHENALPSLANDSIDNNGRKWLVGGLHAAAYAGTLLVLNEAWYKDYPKGKFHSFNDSGEWLQVDKVGHAWSAYQLGRASAASWRWAGMTENQQAWLGAGSGFAFLTAIEILDGFSEEWGWSWSDIAANLGGSSLFLLQQLGWKEQRIAFKFSFHSMQYSDAMLNQRSDFLFGESWYERMLKDYNGQTYWLSANLSAFMPDSRLPKWLNVAVGYGASGMMGAEWNIWTDEDDGTVYDRSDIARRREWYLAPDIDFTRIKTNKQWLRTVFFVLNAFKFPAPALVFSGGKLRIQGFYF